LLLTKLSALIDSGQIVAFVTGRSFAWTKERVVDRLNIKKPENVFVSAEKGGVWAYFSNGEWVVVVDYKIAVPRSFFSKATKLVTEKFQGTMFMDPKQTLISVEIRDGTPLGKFRSQQRKLDECLEEYIVANKLENELEIDSADIATDVESKLAGKRLGAQRVFNWLENQGSILDSFFVFGDRPGDVDIAKVVFEKGKKVEFVFTGNKNLLSDEKLPFPIKIYDAQYEKGTLAYLTRISI